MHAPIVHLQVVLPIERLVANLALIASIIIVDYHVLIQIPDQVESGAANFAFKWLFSGVSSHVPF